MKIDTNSMKSLHVTPIDLPSSRDPPIDFLREDRLNAKDPINMSHFQRYNGLIAGLIYQSLFFAHFQVSSQATR